MALKHIHQEDHRDAIIYSDSLSSLQALSSYNHHVHPVLNDIQHELTSLHEQEFYIRFCWIPGHVGIPGNTAADDAAGKHSDEIDQSCPIPCSDIRSLIQGKVHQQWQQDWSALATKMESENKSLKLHDIKPILSNWQSSYRTNRREEVVLSRLRIGHTHLTHGHLLRRELPPECTADHQALTVKHILLDCTLYARERAKHLNSPGNNLLTLSSILDDNTDLEGLFLFLRETGLIPKL
jgi:hypothetical protein